MSVFDTEGGYVLKMVLIEKYKIGVVCDEDAEAWKKHGRSDKWTRQRMRGQGTRSKLTDYWSNHDIKKGKEFAIRLKGIKSQNLQGHMNEADFNVT